MLCSDELGSYPKDDPQKTSYIHDGHLRMAVAWNCSDDDLNRSTEKGGFLPVPKEYLRTKL